MAKEDYKGIWVFAEQQGGFIEPTVMEILAKAGELKAVNGEDITAVLLGSGVAGLTDTLFEYGADKVILAEHENLKEYSARPYQKAFAGLAGKYKPSIVLYPATALGRDLAPRVMCSVDTGLTADAIDLGFDEDGVFYQTTPAYGGSILAHIVILERRPQMATVRAQMFAPIEPMKGARGEVVVEKVEAEADDDFVVLNDVPKQCNSKPISEAGILVAGGRGIKNEEDLAMLNELAELVGGQIASSRPLVDNGLLTHEKQIGQSGATVKPDFIFNIAISGSVQYEIGMQNSKCIISVNHSADVPIFDISHYGAVADYRKLIPAIIAEIKARKA